MLKKIVPALLVAGAAINVAQAAEETSPIIGFEFGVNYILPFDDRFEGASTSFALVFPLGSAASVAVYHENVRLNGNEEDTDEDVDGTVNELRFKANIWNGAKQDLDLVVGVGHAEWNYRNYGEELSGIVGDVGVQFTVIKAKSGPVTGEANLNVTARFAPHDTDEVYLDDSDDYVENQNALMIGISAGLMF